MNPAPPVISVRTSAPPPAHARRVIISRLRASGASAAFRRLGLVPIAAIVGLAPMLLPAATRVETLTAIGGLPPEIVGVYREPAAFQRVASGQYLVFDRRAHAVFGVDADMTTTWKLVDIGQESGRLLDPSAFDADGQGTFVVADAPRGVERVQIFAIGGRPLGGFSLPGRSVPRITLGSLVLSGSGSLQFTGRSILLSQPETGWLLTEFGLGGTPTRSIGALRPTGHEDDRALHLAFNAGLPLANPKGGFYFVFLAGMPAFRKYDASGQMVYERHVEGVELDPVVQRLPTAWPRRQTGDGDVPLVAPIVRTAAVDPEGNLWISLMLPFTYVYDSDGEKTRVVQFKGAGIIQPTSLSFAGPRRLLVTPGCYEFDTRPAPAAASPGRRR